MANKPGFGGNFTITTVENLFNQWERRFTNTQSIAFNGVSGQSQCTVPDDPSLSFGATGLPAGEPSFSWAAWVKPTGDLTLFGDPFIVASKCSSSGAGDEYIFGHIPGVGLTLLIADGSGVTDDFIAQTNATIVVDEWQHVCATYDGSRTPGGIKLYVNGALAPFTAGLSPGSYSAMANSTADVVLGRMYAGSTATVAEGFIDEIAAFGKELSAPEVAEIYSSGFAIDYTTFSGAPSLVSWWRMGDKATGTSPNFIIPDQVGSNNARMLSFLGDSTSGVVEDARPGATTGTEGRLPISLATKGILFRQRAKPYLVSQGNNPDDIIT